MFMIPKVNIISEQKKVFELQRQNSPDLVQSAYIFIKKLNSSLSLEMIKQIHVHYLLKEKFYLMIKEENQKSIDKDLGIDSKQSSKYGQAKHDHSNHEGGQQPGGKKNKKKKKVKQGCNSLQDKPDQSLQQQNTNIKQQDQQQTKNAEKVSSANPSVNNSKSNQPEKQIKLETIKEQEQRLREQQTLKFVRQMMIDDKPELETLQDQISFSRDKLEERQSLLTGQLVLNRYHDEEAGLLEDGSIDASTAQNQNNKKKKKKRKNKGAKQQQQPTNEKLIEEELKNELADHKQYIDDTIQLQTTINETFSELQEKETIVQNEQEDQQDDIEITQRLAQEYTAKICANIISTYDEKEDQKQTIEINSTQSQYIPPVIPELSQPIKSQQETEQKYLLMKKKYGKKPRGTFTSNKPKQPPVPLHKINNDQQKAKDNIILNSSLKCQQLESVIEEDSIKESKLTEEKISEVLEKFDKLEIQEEKQSQSQDSKIELDPQNSQNQPASQQEEEEIIKDKVEEIQNEIKESVQNLQESATNHQIHQDKEMALPQYHPKQKHGDNNQKHEANYKESKPPLKDRKYVKKQPQQQQVKYESYEDMFRKNFEKTIQKKIFATLKQETIEKTQPQPKSEDQSPSNQVQASETPQLQPDQQTDTPIPSKQPQQQKVSHLPLNPNTHKYKKNKNSGEKKEMGICANPNMTNEARKQPKKQKTKILINNQDPQTSLCQPQTQLINPNLHQQRSSTPQNELQIEPLAPIITSHQQQSVTKPIVPTPQNQSSKQGGKNQKHGKHHPSKKKNSSSTHGHGHGHGNHGHTHGHGHGHHSQLQHVSYPQQDLKQQSYHLNHQQSFNQQQMQQAYFMQQQQQQQQQYMMPFQFLTPQFFLPPQQIFSQQQMPMSGQPYLPSSAMGHGSQSQPHIQLSHSPQPIDYNMLPENFERNSQQTQTDETRILTNENPMQFSEKRYSKSPPLLLNQYQSFNNQMAPPMSHSPFIPPQNQYNPIQYTNQWQPQTEVFNSPVLSHANSQNLIMSLIQSAQSPQFNPNPSMLYHQIQNIQSPSPIFSPQPPTHHFDMNYPFQSPTYWQYGQQQQQLPPQYNNSNQYNTNTTSLRNNHHQHQPQVRVSHENLEDYQRNMIIVDAQEHFYIKLNEEIEKMANKLKQKLQKTDRERNLAFKNIEYYVKDTYQEYPDVQIQMYGSMATGLAIDSSDMDILVQGVFNHQKGGVDRLILVEQMQRLHRQLNNLFCIESNSLIETATVPVIKLVLNLQKIREAENHLDSLKADTEFETDVIESDMQQLKIDITFDDSEGDFDGGLAQPVHMGIQCCHLIKQKLYDYQPHLEPLVLVLKKFLAVKDLNSPFFGGLSSYGLILLVIAYINQDSSFIYDSQGNVQTSRIFTNFLQFYGYLFDTQFQKVDEYTMIAPHLNFQSILTIIDPLNPNNNIGKSTYNFDKIKLQFQSAYLKVAKKCEEFINMFNQEVQEHDNISNAAEAIKIKKLKLIDMIMSNEEEIIEKVNNEVVQQEQNQQQPQSEEQEQQPQSQSILQEQNDIQLVS